METDFNGTGSQAPEKKEPARRMRREMTAQETALGAELRASRLGGLHFRRQQVMHGFIADFYCHSAQLVIELDGSVHDGQADYDTERDALLAAHGLRVLRIANRQIDEDIKSALVSILAAAQP